jgi:tripartite-type tricarboxylate transporter receptor subunit TctC
LAAIAALVASSGPLRAADWPAKSVTIVVPFGAGGNTDMMARLAAQHLSNKFRQSFVVENRPGAGGALATGIVASAAPDGHTLLFAASSMIVLTPQLQKLSFDPMKQLVPITNMGTGTQMIGIKRSLPAQNLAEFVAYAKANPGKLNFGYGQGTLPHLIGAMFKLETGIEFNNIPYKGGAQAVTDMLGGRIHMNFGTPSTLVPLIRDGRLRALAVTSAERFPSLPEVPTMAESGFPKVTTISYYGIFGPAGLPADIVKRINEATNEALKSSDVKAGLARRGFAVKGGSPQDYASLIAAEMQKWLPVVKATGFTM